MDNTHKELEMLTMNTVKSNRWLKSARLKAEREGLIISAQAKNLQTKNHQADKKNKNKNKRRRCELKTESIDHFVSSRLIQTPIKYKVVA